MHFQVHFTIWLALMLYTVAASLMLSLRGGDWQALTVRGQLARWLWTWACLVYLIHVAMAFHYVHEWSHAQAMAHVEDETGFGEGIFVSYAFTLWWFVDVMWWWLSPNGYTNRSIWIGRALHGFMLFIIFNGTIVFETGFSRWLGIGIFSCLFYLAQKRRDAEK